MLHPFSPKLTPLLVQPARQGSSPAATSGEPLGLSIENPTSASPLMYPQPLGIAGLLANVRNVQFHNLNNVRFGKIAVTETNAPVSTKSLTQEEIQHRREMLPLCIQMMISPKNKPQYFDKLLDSLEAHPSLEAYPELMLMCSKTLTTGEASPELATIKREETQLLKYYAELQQLFDTTINMKNGEYEKFIGQLSGVLKYSGQSILAQDLLVRMMTDDVGRHNALPYADYIEDLQYRQAILARAGFTEADFEKAKERYRSWYGNNATPPSFNEPAALHKRPVTKITNNQIKLAKQNHDYLATLFVQLSEPLQREFITRLFDGDPYNSSQATAVIKAIGASPKEQVLPEQKARLLTLLCETTRGGFDYHLIRPILIQLPSDEERLKWLTQWQQGYNGKLRQCALYGLSCLEDTAKALQLLKEWGAGYQNIDDPKRFLETLADMEHFSPEGEAFVIAFLKKVPSPDRYRKEILKIMNQPFSEASKLDVIEHWLHRRFASEHRIAFQCFQFLSTETLKNKIYPELKKFHGSDKGAFYAGLALHCQKKIEQLQTRYPYAQWYNQSFINSPQFQQETYFPLTFVASLSTAQSTHPDGREMIHEKYRQFNQVIHHLVTQDTDRLNTGFKIAEKYASGILQGLDIVSPGTLKRAYNQNPQEFPVLIERLLTLTHSRLNLALAKSHLQDPNTADPCLRLMEGFVLLEKEETLNALLENPDLNIKRLSQAFLKELAKKAGLTPEAITRAEKTPTFSDWIHPQLPTLGSALRRFHHPENFYTLIKASLTGQYNGINQDAIDFLHNENSDHGLANHQTATAFRRAKLNYPLWLSYPKVLRFRLSQASFKQQFEAIAAGIAKDVMLLRSLPVFEPKIKDIMDKLKVTELDGQLVHHNTKIPLQRAELLDILNNFYFSITPEQGKVLQSDQAVSGAYQRLYPLSKQQPPWATALKLLSSGPGRDQNLEIGVWKRVPARDLFHSNFVQNCIAMSTIKDWEKGYVDALVDALLHTLVQVVEVRDPYSHLPMGQAMVFWAKTQNQTPVMLVDHISLKKEYRGSTEIAEAITRFLQEYANDVAGRSDAMVILGDGGYNQIPSQPFISTMVPSLQLLGDTLHHTFYMDSFDSRSWSPVNISQKFENRPFRALWPKLTVPSLETEWKQGQEEASLDFSEIL